MRPLDYLAQITRRYPPMWGQVAKFLADRKELGDWPEWCYLPMAACYAIAGQGQELSIAQSDAIAELGALIPWRATKGIYRFDPDLASALLETPVEKIPVEVIYRLPEWCCYLDLAGLRLGCEGVFVHLEYDANDGAAELRYLLDCQPHTLIPLIVHLEPGGDLVAGLERTIEEGRINLGDYGTPQEARAGRAMLATQGEDVIAAMRRTSSALLSLTLYLCAENPDWRNLRQGPEAPARPARPKVKTIKGGRQLPEEAKAPNVWETGFRLGELLRRSAKVEGPPTGAHVRPHVRRAHWHLYWTGTKTEMQKPVLKWLHPILVNAQGESGPEKATIRHVKG